MGDAARLLGDRAAARAYYTQALEVCTKIRYRPEIALARLSLAELLLEEPDDAARSEAREHLDIAIPELRDMHMQPALERALALIRQASSFSSVTDARSARRHPTRSPRASGRSSV